MVGVALIVGLLTRLTAVFGLAINLAFMWSGASATNPPFIVLQLAIIVLGVGAGAYGLDRWVLPRLTALAGPRLTHAWGAGVIAVALLFVAWLMLIASDWQTWLVAALIAVAAAVLARSPRSALLTPFLRRDAASAR